MPEWLDGQVVAAGIAIIGFIVWLVRLEAKVIMLNTFAERQREHNNRLYNELRSVNNNLHLIMGKLGIQPIE